MDGLGWPTDMVANLRLNCIYIGDRYGSGKTLEQDYPGIFVLTESEMLSHHELDVTPGGLSITQDGFLLVVCERDKKSRSLRFFRSEISSGAIKLVAERQIEVPMDRYLLQAVAVNSERFVISRFHKSRGIHCIVVADSSGTEVSQVFSANSVYVIIRVCFFVVSMITRRDAVASPSIGNTLWHI